MRSSAYVFALILFLIESSIFGQNLKVELSDIIISKGSGTFATCEGKLRFKGPDILAAQFQKVDTKFTALDDQGNDLANDFAFGFHSGEFQVIEQGTDAVEWDISLRKSPVNSSSLKLLKGKLILFNSELDPESKLEYKGFKSHPNESILKTKATADLEVIFMDKKSFEAMPAAGKLKVAALMSLTEPNDQETIEYVTNFFNFAGSAKDNQVIIYLRDDDDKVLGLGFKDGKSNGIEPFGSEKSMKVLKLSFMEAVDKNWSVIVYFHSPKATKTIPFELHNVKLH